MTGRLALIVEDDQKLADIFAAALTSAGFETEIIYMGDEALTRLATLTPAIVVLDLHLPNVSGWQILRQIQADQRLAKTRVIVVTADALKAQDIRGVADLVLLKPISINQLRDMASRLSPSGSLEP